MRLLKKTVLLFTITLVFSCISTGNNSSPLQEDIINKAPPVIADVKPTKTVQRNIWPVKVTGKVTWGKAPVKDLLVTLSNGDEEISRTHTNSGGRYTLTIPATGKYSVSFHPSDSLKEQGITESKAYPFYISPTHDSMKFINHSFRKTFNVIPPSSDSPVSLTPSIEWDSVPNTDSYYLTLRERESGNIAFSINTETKTVFTPKTPLKPDTEYTIQVLAFPQNGGSTIKATGRLKTPLLSELKDEKPEEEKLKDTPFLEDFVIREFFYLTSHPYDNHSNESLTPLISWEDVPGAAYYKLKLTEENKGPVFLNYNTGNKTQYTLPYPLKAGTGYDIQVGAFDSNEKLISNATGFLTTAGDPDKKDSAAKRVITGRVTWNNQPLQNSKVRLYNKNTNMESAVFTDSNGNYIFENTGYGANIITCLNGELAQGPVPEKYAGKLLIIDRGTPLLTVMDFQHLKWYDVVSPQRKEPLTVLSSLTPTIVWEAQPEVLSYNVTLKDMDLYQEIFSTNTGDETSFTYKDPLEPNKNYSLFVKGISAEGSVISAIYFDFRTPTQKTEKELP